jgi:hypothetical protein
MRIIKFIVGICCFVAALNLGLCALGGFGWPFAICALGFAGAGWFLISKRKSPMSKKSRVLIFLTICLLGGFTVAFMIPSFVAAKYERSSNACVNNLRQIDAAKQQWALENGKTNGTVVTENDIKPYMMLNSKGEIPKCPQGGIYTIGRVGENPTCSIGNSDWPNIHVLPEDDKENWWTNFKAAYSILFGLRHVQKP